MLTISVLLLTLSVAPETGLYLDGQVDEKVIETPVLLEELQARLPELQVTTTPTQNQGSSYTLTFATASDDQGQARLVFILKDSAKTVLLKRSLAPSADLLATARQIALVVEGVIKRRGDSLNEILKAQRPVAPPKPQPEPLAESVVADVQPQFVLDAALTFGSLVTAGRSTIGTQIGAQVRAWESVRFGLQGGFQYAIAPGSPIGQESNLNLQEWNLVATGSWLLTQGDLAVVTLAGIGIAVTQSNARDEEQDLTYAATDAFMILRASSGITWEINNDFELLALFSIDFAPSFPNYTLEGQLLLSRGSTAIFASLGCRYSLF